MRMGAVARAAKIPPMRPRRRAWRVTSSSSVTAL